ncbi:hypothetical protein PybrP1_012195 [[Pythium] brassicae (nom. inval.)]|nr:hypothetical protein PybrP1_012195 [[Pythium] brassicae (nom. inval.)]
MPPTLRTLAALAAAAAGALARASASPPVYCSDVGLAFEFQKGGGPEREPLASSCLRHAAMNAVGAQLTARLDALAVSAVDCTREAADARFAVLSLCSRSNVQRSATDASAWDADVRALVGDVLGERAAADGVAAGGSAMRWFPRKVQLSPAYALPDGKGMPRFEFQGARLATDRASGALRVELAVRNAGKVPLHLYRAVVTEPAPSGGAAAKADPTAVRAELPGVAAVGPGKAALVVFTSGAASPLALALSKEYVVYIAHSGFRAHRFEGVLSGDGAFVVKPAAFSSTEKRDELFGAALSTSSGMDPLLSSFPLGSWRGSSLDALLFSVGIVAVVGLAAVLYARRRWPRVPLRDLSHCLQRSMKQSAGGASSVRAASKRVQESGGDWKSRTSDMDMHADSALDHEMDELESDGLITAPVAAPRSSKARQSVTREKMPAIQMQWTPPASTSGRFRRPLDLDKDVQLDPKRFENLWDEYLQRFQSSEVQDGRVDSTALLDRMQALGVACMASGTVNGVEKYVFYAQQHASSWYFFLVVDITLATRTMGVTVRTSSDASDALVEDFVRAAKTAIQEAVVMRPTV